MIDRLVHLAEVLTPTADFCRTCHRRELLPKTACSMPSTGWSQSICSDSGSSHPEPCCAGMPTSSPAARSCGVPEVSLSLDLRRSAAYGGHA